tara:strand:+ start:527 stop:808 length:282 start_codon:yes stop_codon:yes gene_type:complete
VKKLNRQQIRSTILKEFKTILVEGDDDSRTKEFFDFATEVRDELEGLLKDYDKFLDGAESWAMKNGLSNKAAEGFLKYRLEKLKEKVDGLPFA